MGRNPISNLKGKRIIITFSIFRILIFDMYKTRVILEITSTITITTTMVTNNHPLKFKIDVI